MKNAILAAMLGIGILACAAYADKIEWAMPTSSAAPTATPPATEVGLLKVSPPTPPVPVTPSVYNLCETNGWKSGRTFSFTLTLLPGTSFTFTDWTIVQTGWENTKPNVTIDISGDVTASLGAATFKGLGSNTLNFDCDDVTLSTGSYTVSVLMRDPDLAGDGSWNALNKLSFTISMVSVPPMFSVTAGSLHLFTNTAGSTTVGLDPSAGAPVKAVPADDRTTGRPDGRTRGNGFICPAPQR